MNPLFLIIFLPIVLFPSPAKADSISWMEASCRAGMPPLTS